MILALQSRPDLWRFVKFLFVGVINTAFGFAAYAILLWAGLPPQPALALSYVMGVDSGTTAHMPASSFTRRAIAACRFMRWPTACFTG